MTPMEEKFFKLYTKTLSKCIELSANNEDKIKSLISSNENLEVNLEYYKLEEELPKQEVKKRHKI